MTKVFFCAAVLVSTFSVPAFADEKFDWSRCDAKIEEFCKELKGSKDDKAIYECLLKHDNKLGKCDETHNKYEKVHNLKHQTND